MQNYKNKSPALTTRKTRGKGRVYADADDTFACIAGYTPGGVPYGVTWEELGEEPRWLSEEEGSDRDYDCVELDDSGGQDYVVRM